MTAQKSLRKKFSSLLATGTAALLAASGLALAPTAAFADEPVTPTIKLSKTMLDPAGDTLTVTGTGFDTSFVGIPAYYGCSDPTNAPKGFYVQIGWIKDTWKPSEGGVSNGATPDRKGGPNTWFADGDLNCQAPSTWTVEDGTASFEYTVTLTQEDLGELPEGARYAVFTHGGAATAGNPATQQPINEVSQDIVFGGPATVDPVVAASATGLSVQVSASALPLDVSNLYAALIVKGTEEELVGQDATGYAAFAYPFPSVSAGTTSFNLVAPKANLDRTEQYEVLLWATHSNPTPSTIYGRADVAVTSVEWDKVFPPTTPVDPKPTVTFTDVKKGQKFYAEISWMASEGISTGVKQANGTFQYQPKNNVTREAMAAFLYRQYGDKNFKAPKVSLFTDVKPGDKFYKEIAWMASEGISTGVKQTNGTVKFQPKSGITREAMAAFMYRIDEGKKPAVPAVSPFADVQKGDKFYKEIVWMSQSKLSTGIKQPSGKPVYAAKSNVTREAMAAFLYRTEAR